MYKIRLEGWFQVHVARSVVTGFGVFVSLSDGPTVVATAYYG